MSEDPLESQDWQNIEAANQDEEPTLNGSGFEALRQLLDKSWWQHTFAFIWMFRRLTIKPAFLMAFSLIALRLQEFCIAKSMFKEGAYNGMQDVLSHIGVAIFFLLGLGIPSLVAMVWSIALFVIVLTGFCRAFLAIEPGSLLQADQLDKDSVNLGQQEAVAFFKTRKTYLVLVWFFWSLIMLVPSAVFGTAAIFFAATVAGVLPLPLAVPPELQIGSLFVAIISGILISNYFLIAMPVSSQFQKTGRKVAVDSLMMSLKAVPALSIISSIVLILGSLATYWTEIPVQLVNHGYLPPLNEYLYLALNLISAGWQGVSAIIIYPLSLAIPCELVRKK
ncbi:MAG: hypothetical protein K8F91_12730 [Candidatus Obscuribacterales bacterium]|nr:hypothetical protein [Candidatus Obscuribacterales bacterium]